LKIGHIALSLPSGVELKVEAIERGDGELSDQKKKDQALRIQEIKYQREIATGARLRLYNAQGRLETEIE